MTPHFPFRLSRKWKRGLFGSMAALAGLYAFARWGPMSPLFTVPHCTVLLDREGGLLGASVAEDGQWRFPAVDSVPDRFATCLIQFEDRHFFQHPGVRLPSLLRAFRQNNQAGRTVSGGSTLTMQVARLSRNGRARTYGEKMIETLLALRLETRYTKQEILGMFASNAPFGGNVVGLDAASWRYFGRPPTNLSWAEAATLAVLPNAPSDIYPGKGQDALRRKRDRLLDRLLVIKTIDTLEWSLAKQEPLPGRVRQLPQHAPHLLATLRAQGHAGEIVHTTIDAAIQEHVATAADHHSSILAANEVHNAAVLVLDVATGEVLAYLGNLPAAGPDHAGQVDIIRAQRSTGSILKPFLYADMLQSGELLPDMLVADLPTQYDGFAPRNFDEHFSGAVPASEALARSLNVPAVRALRLHGIERTLTTFRAIGLHSIDRPAGHYGLSLIVGGAESNLWELTGAYASMERVLEDFGKGGLPYRAGDIHPPQALLSRTPAPTPTAIDHPVLDAASIFFTLKALREVKRPEEEAGWQQFGGSQRIAWKTGTSFGHRDAWAIGLSGRYCVGVWTGNADGEGRPGLTGVLAAAPILFEVFSHLPSAPAPEAPFDAMTKAPICRASGFRAGLDCQDVDTLFIPPQGERTRTCPYHQRITVDASERYQVSLDEGGHSTSWFVLSPAMERYHAPLDPHYRPLPPWKNGTHNEASNTVMEMIYPEPGARLLVPEQLDGSRGKAVLEAAHRQHGMAVHWSLDGQYIGTTTDDHHLAVDPVEGEHQLTLTDAEGHVLTTHFTVVSNASGTDRP